MAHGGMRERVTASFASPVRARIAKCFWLTRAELRVYLRSLGWLLWRPGSVGMRSWRDGSRGASQFRGIRRHNVQGNSLLAEGTRVADQKIREGGGFHGHSENAGRASGTTGHSEQRNRGDRNLANRWAQAVQSRPEIHEPGRTTGSFAAD